MHRVILPRVIFSPGELALELARELARQGGEVTLFTPGPIDSSAAQVTADLSLFERELDMRGDDYLELLKKHPLVFISLARQAQSEIIARAYRMANEGELDIVHIYANEEDIALSFAALCNVPVVFTHHDPFNFTARYRAVFPRYASLNWISMSMVQRKGMPDRTNWVGNIYHGLAPDKHRFVEKPSGGYILYLGRIVASKGLHLAIAAVDEHNRTADRKYRLVIAGKHYSGAKDHYWNSEIEPLIDGEIVTYAGFVADTQSKQDLIGNATCVIVPSVFDEPFGMVMIEAFACGTPVIGLDSGAITEVVEDSVTGIVVRKTFNGQFEEPADRVVDEVATVRDMAAAIGRIHTIDRGRCRQAFDERFTLDRMGREHLAVYEYLVRESLSQS